MKLSETEIIDHTTKYISIDTSFRLFCRENYTDAGMSEFILKDIRDHYM